MRESIKANDPKAQFRLGLAYFELKKFAQAKKQFEIVLSLDHRYPNINQCMANALLELGDRDTALHFYFRQMEIDPWFETYFNIGVLLMAKDRFNEALLYFAEGLKKNSEDVATHLNCGSIYLKKNDIQKAILSYTAADKLKPNDPEITHILSALQQNALPEKAPTEFVSHLFDHYAPYYDFHLTNRLQYDSPQKMLAVFLQESAVISREKWAMIDLGCGTGLCGVLFKPYVSSLTGIDASEKMLSCAREKNCYDQLICADIESALATSSPADLIIAADVFTYIGKLDALFARVQKKLTQNGLFIFTVEKTHAKDFILQTSIRYAHSKNYLEQLITRHHFEMLRFENIVLRTQKNEPVEGCLVVLKHQ